MSLVAISLALYYLYMSLNLRGIDSLTYQEDGRKDHLDEGVVEHGQVHLLQLHEFGSTHYVNTYVIVFLLSVERKSIFSHENSYCYN